MKVRIAESGNTNGTSNTCIRTREHYRIELSVTSVASERRGARVGDRRIQKRARIINQSST